MPAYFCESSAIVKRYVQETGTHWMTTLLRPAAGNRIYLASLTGVEVVAAMARRQRSGSLSAADASLASTQFRQDFISQYRRVRATHSLIERGMDLAEKHALRGYDAMQLAAALRVYDACQSRGIPFVLVSADMELSAAAQHEGLTTDDPNTHP